jgi:hypothetical protein
MPLPLEPAACVPTCLNVTQSLAEFHANTGTNPATEPSTNSQNPSRLNSARR